MRARLAAALVLCLLLAPWPACRAQELVFLAPRLDAFWDGDDGHLLVQSGRRVFRFDVPGEGAPVLAGGGAVPGLSGSPAFGSATFFDARRGEVLMVARDRWSLKGPKSLSVGEVGEPFFRRPWSEPPVRLPLLGAAGARVVPGRAGFRAWLAGKPNPPLEIGFPPGGEANLGWGLGDDMVVTTTMPWALFRASAAGGPAAIVVGRGRRYVLQPLETGASARPLEEAPFDDEEGILDIPYGIPPLLADLDGDAGEDLLLADPSAGALILYSDLDAGEPGVSRVIKLGGLAVATWARDLDGDGRADLSVLRLPTMGPLLQVRVLREGSVDAELMVYLRTDAGLPASPDLSAEVKLPLKVAIRNGVREARLPEAVVPLPGPAVLVVEPGGSVYHQPLKGERERRLVGRVPEGSARDPFGGLLLPNGRVVFAWTTPADRRLYCAGPF